MQLPPFPNSVFSSVLWFGDELGILLREKLYFGTGKDSTFPSCLSALTPSKEPEDKK